MSAVTTKALREHVVYRLYSDDRLIYIGVTGNIAKRFETHRYCTPWFSEVTRVDVETFPNRRVAFAAETAAIRAEQPLYNVRHAAGWVEPCKRTAGPRAS